MNCALISNFFQVYLELGYYLNINRLALTVDTDNKYLHQMFNCKTVGSILNIECLERTNADAKFTWYMTWIFLVISGVCTEFFHYKLAIRLIPVDLQADRREKTSIAVQNVQRSFWCSQKEMFIWSDGDELAKLRNCENFLVRWKSLVRMLGHLGR